MFKSIATCAALLFMAPLQSQARPFTVKDLALLDRVSDPRISPDARFVAYNLRSMVCNVRGVDEALAVTFRSPSNLSKLRPERL
jgi:hypothetical protein